MFHYKPGSNIPPKKRGIIGGIIYWTLYFIGSAIVIGLALLVLILVAWAIWSLIKGLA